MKITLNFKNSAALFFVAVLALLPTQAFAKCEINTANNKVENCPEYAKDFLENLNICTHFISEQTGGASPERDKEVEKALNKHRCLENDEKNFQNILKKLSAETDYSTEYGFINTLNSIDSYYILDLYKSAINKNNQKK